MSLRIPTLRPTGTMLDAASAYAEAGWYVLPIDPTTKHPGSVVGNGWQDKSSRHPEQIRAWFNGTNYGLAVHVGLSGAVVFDVDHPEAGLPEELERALRATPAPFQSTRDNNPRRGHYVFAVPEGKAYSNSTAGFGEQQGWGEVRGLNGIIVVEPTIHTEEHGRYRWESKRRPPMLPDYLARKLREPGETKAADNDAVSAFLAEHEGDEEPARLERMVEAFWRDVNGGMSRHQAMLRQACNAMREARAGLFPALKAASLLEEEFETALAGDRPSEFASILAFAVGAANESDPEEVRDRAGLFDWLARPVEEVEEPKGLSESFDIAPDGWRLTDVGHAHRFAKLTEGRCRWVSGWDRWVVYRGGVWVLDDASSTKVLREAQRVGPYLLDLAGTVSSEDLKEQLQKSGVSCEYSARLRAIATVSAQLPELELRYEELDADPHLLNVRNGVLDLRTGELKPHSPDQMCSLQAPVEWDPDAGAPTWLRCLEEWQPDPEIRNYLQREVGAGATGIATETVSIHHGLGGNGKSKFFEAIMHVLGPYAVVPHKSLLVAQRFQEHPTQVAKLFRKRLAVASETNRGDKLDEELVKNLTGGDRLEGRRMRENPWEFQPSHTLVIFSNHQPQIEGTDEGIWRRMRLIPWDTTIPLDRQDRELSGKLRAEASGVLRWLVEGARAFLNEGGKLSPPDKVLAATERYRGHEDSVQAFLEDCGIVFEPEATTPTSLLRDLHEGWAADNAEHANSHWRRVTDRFKVMPGVRQGRSHGGVRTWVGVKVGGAATPPKPDRADPFSDEPDEPAVDHHSTNDNPSWHLGKRCACGKVMRDHDTKCQACQRKEG